MRLFCWFCHKSVSNEVPDETILRAVCVCPECAPLVFLEDDVIVPLAPPAPEEPTDG